MKGRIFVPYIKVDSSATQDASVTGFFRNPMMNEEYIIGDGNNEVNLITWTMKYYMLDGLQWIPSPDNYGWNSQSYANIALPDSSIRPSVETTIAIHFKWGMDNSHSNPSESYYNPVRPSDGKYDHIDILPLFIVDRQEIESIPDQTGDIISDILTGIIPPEYVYTIDRNTCNISFENMYRGIASRKISIWDNRDTYFSDNNLAYQYGYRWFAPLSNSSTYTTLPYAPIDNTVGRTKYLCEPLKENNSQCGFGNDNWWNSFGVNRPDKYKDILYNNSSAPIYANCSTLMRHMTAATQAITFTGSNGSNYQYYPSNSGIVDIANVMWGVDPDTSYLLYPGNKIWWPSDTDFGSTDGSGNSEPPSMISMAVHNTLTFYDKEGTLVNSEYTDQSTSTSQIEFWFGDLGANYAAKNGLNGCINYSDHGIHIFNDSDGYNIGRSTKFDIMMIPSLYEMNTSIDIVTGGYGDWKYKIRDHDLGFSSGNTSDHVENPIIEQLPQPKIIQLWCAGTHKSTMGEDYWCPF